MSKTLTSNKVFCAFADATSRTHAYALHAGAGWIGPDIVIVLGTGGDIFKVRRRLVLKRCDLKMR